MLQAMPLMVLTLFMSCNIKMIVSQCDLTCENVDDDIAEIVEEMDNLGMHSFVDITN